MFKLLKIFHFLALCIFIGSIPVHIVLGALAAGADDYGAVALYHQAKLALTAGLAAAGLAAVVASGALLVVMRRRLLKARWLQLKLLIVLFIVMNAAFVLMPVARDMAELTVAAHQTGVLDKEFASMHLQESIAGAVNLIAILIAVLFAALKPRLGQMPIGGQMGRA